jgi:hypothetical protein
VIGARTYFVQQESSPLAAGAPRILPGNTFSLRQDRSGLYQLDVLTPLVQSPAPTEAVRASIERAVAEPAARAAFERAYARLTAQLAAARLGAGAPSLPRPGGPDPGELSLLRYPLAVGARWTVRESPRFVRVVVGRERLLVPAGAFVAWRLRGLSELYGPEDRVAFWYSSAGLVRISTHAEAPATDDSGNVIGRVIGDENQVLTALRLVDPNAPRADAEAPVEGVEPR